MRRLLRRSLNSIAAVSAMLCVLTCALWARSEGRGEGRLFQTGTAAGGFSSRDGRLVVWFGTRTGPPTSEPAPSAWSEHGGAEYGFRDQMLRPVLVWPGFLAIQREEDMGMDSRRIGTRHWVVFAACSAVPLTFLVRFAGFRRARLSRPVFPVVPAAGEGAT